MIYTTPVVYLYLDSLAQWTLRTRGRLLPRLFGDSAPPAAPAE